MNELLHCKTLDVIYHYLLQNKDNGINDSIIQEN